MENNKELFIKAFMEAERISNADYMNIEEVDIVFSPEFERKMNKLLQKNNRIHFSTRRYIKKSLLAAIITMLIIFTALMSVSAIRTPFIEFIKKVFPQFNEITLREDSTPPVDRIETEYTLTALPEGFEIKEYQKDEFGVFTVWRNQNGDEIVFSQDLLNININIDNEHNYKEITINNRTAYYTENKNSANLVWSDGYYWFTIQASENCKDDIMDLQKKISKKI